MNDSVRLKISYNSTRRAAWYTKLGYQRQCDPVAIPLRTIHPKGGPIAHIKIFIARVYPLRYLEHVDGAKGMYTLTFMKLLIKNHI